jgi:diamine N-acetyltransferase
MLLPFPTAQFLFVYFLYKKFRMLISQLSKIKNLFESLKYGCNRFFLLKKVIKLILIFAKFLSFQILNNFTKMKFLKVSPDSDLSESVNVLNLSHETVAKEFGFTKDDNPSNNAFINVETLKAQLEKGIDLYLLLDGNKAAGCIAIEKSLTEIGTFYIEKVSVVPAYRHNGYGTMLMNFATEKIKKSGGKSISIALINSNTILKKWYLNQGFFETSIKDFPHLPFRVCFMNKQL